MPNYYPVMLDVRERAVLVIGGNTIAAEKASALSASGARVTVMANNFCAEIQDIAQKGLVALWQKTYERGDLHGFFIVVAVTTYEPALSEIIWAEGQENNQLVNIVDYPSLCNFIVPSLLRRGQLTIAVSTEGSSPGLAKRIRQQLESEFPGVYEDYLRIASVVRGYMRAQGLSYGQRDDFFGEFFASQILQQLEQQQMIEAFQTTVDLLHRYNVVITLEHLEQDMQEHDRAKEHTRRV